MVQGFRFVHCAAPTTLPDSSNYRIGKVNKRTKTGCLTCRKRKKKCDETHPSCSGCNKNSLECIWSDPMKLSSSQSQVAKNTIDQIIDLQIFRENEKQQEISDPSQISNDLSFSQFLDEDLNFRPDDELNTFLQLNYQSVSDPYLTSIDPSLNLTPFTTWIPNVNLSSESAFLYHVFITDFLRTISPQFTHPKLSILATWVPPAAKSEILREVFYSCASAYLSWKNPEYKEIGHAKYLNLIKMIKIEIESGRVDGSEDWLVLSVLILSIREKIFGANTSKSAKHLSATFKMIQTRQKVVYGNTLLILDNHSNEETEDFEELENLSLFDDILNEGNYIFNQPIQPISQTKAIIVDETDAFDKTVIQSCVYHYSISLLLCQKQEFSELPSPFKIFKELDHFLKKPIYSCPVEWMNNCIVGAAIDGFEYAAKASWISRFKNPLNSYWRKKTESLYESALCYIPPVLDPKTKLQINNNDYKSLFYNILIASCMVKASLILLRKILNPLVETSDRLIQECVRYIYKTLNKIPKDHFTNSIIGWMLIVTGSCSIDLEHQFFFKQRCIHLGEFLHRFQYSDSIFEFFDIAWGYNGVVGKGCDILLDRDCLEGIST